MELHTTLGTLKAQAQAQAMTRLTAEARRRIDPAFANGMGSLQETVADGLRCPLKGCGSYHHNLGVHLTREHAMPTKLFRRLLDLPTSAPLLSRVTLAKMRGHKEGWGGIRLIKPTRKVIQAAAQQREKDAATMGARNLEGRCDAQLGQRLEALEEAVGHSPTMSEATEWWGAGLVSYIVRHYGSWNAFKAKHDVPTNKQGGPETVPVERVVEMLKDWHQVRGALPTYDETASAERKLLPHPSTVLRAFCAEKWETAMLRAAAVLRIHDPRYSPVAGHLRRCECGQLTKLDPCQACGLPSLVLA